MEQQAQSLAKLEESAKQADGQVKTLTAELNKFQVVLSEFDKVLRVLNDRSTEMDRRVSDGQAMKTLAAKTEQQAARLDVLEKTLAAAIVTQKEMSGSLGELKRVMEESVGRSVARPDVPPDIPTQPAKRTSIPAEPSRPAGAVPKIEPESVLSAKDAYDRAQGQFGKGQYDIALTSFKLFLIQYPDSSLVPNAYFWMAECYFRTRDYERGIEEYEQVVKNYPKSEKASRALYRKAMAFLELNDTNAARTTLRQLIAAYPNSEDSKQARTKLASLK
jgi:tol-pal system protein YbgF